ncbi:ATP-binding protein [Paludibacterium paludis]|uniref:histidine kinase n=1 Tax=Paludibacterium paludis TaxID=1225769 RepID=A0A918P310_9NEIS|nr:ATP-binding protein [Paludibacterium paludis]GGY16873.1 two-component sensor histidine kinase [Paludibacterium paludis]
MTRTTYLRNLFRPSLTTLFFRYYLTALVALVLIITGVGVVIDKIYGGIDEENGRNFMRGTVTMIETELQRHPAAQWDDTLRQLGKSFSYPLQLRDLARVGGSDAALRQEVANGVLHVDADDMIVYHRVGDSQRVLVLGPLEVTQDKDALLSEENHIQILWWTLTGLGFGIIVYLGIRPVWLDLVAVRITAENLAGGDMSARAAPARSWLVSPLARGLNTMADHVERQLATQQALAHAVAHELRTPIARLRFGLTMLDEAENTQEFQTYRHGMERDMEELDELVNASLRYARLNRGDVILHPEDTPLREWFGELAEMVGPLTPEGVTLTLAITADSGLFDRGLIWVATRNLLVNALRYAKSQVRLSVSLAGGVLTLAVDDDGPGIPEADRAAIFDPFHRLDSSRDRSTGGYGLGLSFVRLIAQHHGGQAHVGDSPLGGARFTVTLPGQDKYGSLSQTVTL